MKENIWAYNGHNHLALFLRIIDTLGLLLFMTYVTTWRFQSIVKQFITLNFVVYLLVQWVLLWSTNPQIQSSNTAGTFIFVNSGTILKMYPPPIFFLSLNAEFSQVCGKPLINPYIGIRLSLKPWNDVSLMYFMLQRSMYFGRGLSHYL